MIKLRIEKDTSGITYEYELTKDGKNILMGDGYSTIEEIKDFLRELKEAVNATIDVK